jgi:hypothetical protein
MASPPSNSLFGLWTGGGVLVALGVFAYGLSQQGEAPRSVPAVAPSAAPAPSQSPAPLPPPVPRCARKDVFDQTSTGNAQVLRDYIRECTPNGAFLAQARSALESRLYESALTCIRSSCAPDPCVATLSADFPYSNRIAGLRNEVESVRNSPRCKPPAPPTFDFRICNRTPYNLQVAVMGRQTSDAPWIVQGWAMVYANGCGGAGSYAKGEFYAVAIGPNGMRWGNRDASLCVVSGQRFQRQNTANYNCQSGEVLIPFQRFLVSDTQFTWNLN